MEQEETARTISQITGLSFDQSLALLQQFGTMDAAINSFFEDPEVATQVEPVQEPIESAEEVRAPIPKKREVLLQQSDFRRRRGATITEVPFRDFALEGQIHEEMLIHGQVPVAKKSRIETLFMPPFDILFAGTFESACNFGKTEDKWVMVNLQDDFSFTCQTLNRDLWSDAGVKSIVKDHIIFWQQSIKTAEGSKFKTFYKVLEEPYIGLIDPRTGEEVQKILCTSITSNVLIQTIKNFLIDNKSPSGIEIAEINPSGKLSFFNINKPLETEKERSSHKRKKHVEYEPAYEDSFEEPDDDSQDDGTYSNHFEKCKHDIPTENNDKSESSKIEQKTNENENLIPPSERTRLLLKLPESKTDVMFSRKTSTLKDTIGRIMEKIGRKDRLLVNLYCPAIKKDLFTLDEDKTLLQLNIHPSAVIHVTIDE